jgi:hypothetical protein
LSVSRKMLVLIEVLPGRAGECLIGKIGPAQTEAVPRKTRIPEQMPTSY